MTVWIHPPHLINIATLPCENRNSANVILQWDILPKKIASNVSYMLHRNGPAHYKIWGVIQHVRNKDWCHLWPAKMLYVNLGWLWTERYRGCNWPPVARPSEIMCACWWRTLWTHAVKLLFICIMWFIRTFYETVNVIWCIWWLFRS